MRPEGLDNLITEQANAASEGIDALPVEDILRTINAEDQTVAAAVAGEIPAIARAVDAIVARMREGGRLFYVGAGTSGRLGVLDAVECPPTFQTPPDLVQGIVAGGEEALSRPTETSEDDPSLGECDLLARGARSGDVVFGIAASGRTPYVLGALAAARKMGATTAGLACNPGTPLAGSVDYPIVTVTGPEIIAGSTRMKAGTATKLVLNMISTAVMIRLGYVYGNLMVNVQPANSKLSERARRIVAKAGGVSEQAAADLLEAAGGDTRTAILMGRFSADRETARRVLEASGGRLSEAIDAWTNS